MGKLYNLARVTTATIGTGTITLGPAVQNYLTFANAGVQNGDVISYGIFDPPNSEVGQGTYTSAGTTLTRGPTTSTNSNNAISLSGHAQVFITALASSFFTTGISVMDFGAKGDGIIDDKTAIQNAIDFIALTGGQVYFPAGKNFLISNTISIGNGSGSAVSSASGVVLVGIGNPNTPPGVSAGYPTTLGPKITWGGGAGVPMIYVAGPLQGWGIQNLYIDGVSAADVGIEVRSAQYGDNRNLTVVNCNTIGIFSTTWPLFGSVTNTDSLHNRWTNTTIIIPNTVGAKGIVLTGDASGPNTDFNHFLNTSIIFSAVGAMYGIYLQSCDTNYFFNTHMFNGSGTRIAFDYSVVNNCPSANMFYGLDTGGLGTAYANSGSPSISARPNYIIGLAEGNGTPQPNLANLTPQLPVEMTPSLYLTGQSTSISATNLFTTFSAGLYRISYYISTTTPSAGGAIIPQFAWNDGTALQIVDGVTIPSTSSVCGQGSIITSLTSYSSISAVQYAVAFSSVVGSPIYQFSAVAERL